METNDSAATHLAGERLEHPHKKRIKLDRSGLELNLSKPNTVSNGVKIEMKSPKKDEKHRGEINNVKASSESHQKHSLKRPAVESDDDDVPLVARSKIKHSSENSLKSPTKNSPNDVKKIKKIKHESNSSGSPKLEKAKKPSNSDGIKKIKSESGSTTPNKSDGVKKIKPDSGSTKSDGKVKLDSPKVDNVKKVKSDSSKTDGIKKIKSESGLTSPSKSSDVKKNKSESSSSLKSDGVKKIKHEVEASLKIKSDHVSKTPDAKKNKDLLSPKSDGIRKEKHSSSSPAKVDGSKKEGSSIKSEKDKHKTVHSKESGLKTPKTDGIKKEKHKTSSSKSEGVSKSDKTSGLTSPKVDGVKKAKGSSESAKGETIKKSKSESTTKAKVEGVKKVKTENGGKEKTTTDESDADDVPLAARAKVKTESNKTSPSKQRKRKGSDNDDDDYKPLKKLKKKSDVGGKDAKKEKTKSKEKEKPKKGKDGEKTEKGKEEKKGKEKKEEEVWKWWEEEKLPEGVKWLTLEHKGPYFPPEYEPLPGSVNFYYNGEKVKLSVKSEEVAGFYAKMLDHDYASKKIFNDNFFQDWRKEMTDEERALIKHLSKCDFKEFHAYYVQKNEERKNMTKEQKLVIKEKNEAILQEYGYCMMDGHKERVGNFKIEPPGLFRGRGDHPKQGKLKRRLTAKDIIINIGKDAKVPDPPEGQRWKATQHDNKVTWLACWIENIQGSYKYVMLNPTSRIKGEKDWQKYETARKLKNKIGEIRRGYTNDWKSKEMRIRQRGVALYFIDKLALRAGHEKDEDTADTVGCCSLRYEHIKLHKQLDGKEYVVEFDFLGKDSIQYHNIVQVEKRVFKNLELFKQGKSDGDDLFDRLSTTSLNKYLSELMEGLSAKVFRTYNASMTLQDQLNKLEVEDNVAANVLGYNRANRAVAILCNHQRSAPKTFEQSMSNLQQKIDDKKKAIKDAKNELKDLKHESKGSDSVTLARKLEKKKSSIDRLQEQLFKLEVSQTDKNENKEIALGTSKLNYLDPRISIAWCLKNDVPIEKIYNKTQRQKFAWAIDMTEEDFVF